MAMVNCRVYTIYHINTRDMFLSLIPNLFSSKNMSVYISDEIVRAAFMESHGHQLANDIKNYPTEVEDRYHLGLDSGKVEHLGGFSFLDKNQTSRVAKTKKKIEKHWQNVDEVLHLQGSNEQNTIMRYQGRDISIKPKGNYSI